jgi:hypothetical protein
MSPDANPGSQAKARIAGIAYLATIACGLFAEVFARGSIRVNGDPIQTSENLQRLEQLFRWGILADAVMLASYVVVTAMLYRLFKPVNATVSLLAAFFSLVGIALLASCLMALLASLLFVDGGSSLQLWSRAQLSEAAYVALRLHSGGYNLTGFFFGAYCLLIGWLVMRSRWLPLVIGALMMLAGAVFVIDAGLVLVAPASAKRIPDSVMLVSLLGEGSLALWLTAFGVRRPRLWSQLGPVIEVAE